MAFTQHKQTYTQFMKKTQLDKSVFYPAPFIANRHLQMIYNLILQIVYYPFCGVYYKRSVCKLKDGGQIALDYAFASKKETDAEFSSMPKKPILVLHPGYGGHNDDLYIIK